MGIERLFPKRNTPTCYGEAIFSYSSGYPIGQNPEKKLKGTINSVVRMMESPVTIIEDFEHCVRVNAECLKMEPEDLLLLAEAFLDEKNREKESLKN